MFIVFRCLRIFLGITAQTRKSQNLTMSASGSVTACDAAIDSSPDGQLFIFPFSF